MAAPVHEGDLLWEPSEQFKRTSTITRYITWLSEQKQLRFEDYDALWQWSVLDIEGFWSSIWDYFDVTASRPYTRALSSRAMPGARWFVGAKLNYAEHALRADSANRPALLAYSELRPAVEITWEALRQQVAQVAANLRRLGVGRGDRVAAYLPNIPEAAIAFLACASIGAIWSSCSPDFGTQSVIDRFAQIEPKLLLAVDGYRYAGKNYDRRDVVTELRQALPTLAQTVIVSYLHPHAKRSRGDTSTGAWEDLLVGNDPLVYEQVPFDHPLWILYSSGTTGLPKPIVHGHGGILLEHLKAVGLHMNVRREDRLFWYTTTGWMMWNLILGGLLLGATVILYDGSPTTPDTGALWRLAAESGATVFGASASYIGACMKAGVTPGTDHDLSALASIGSTGSPLPPEGFAWVYEHVKRDVWLSSKSGGTDICSAFLTGCPLLPVRAGELQCRALGADVQAWNDRGLPVVGAVGELVVTKPLPSMPLMFWHDPDFTRYRASYFEMYPGVWRHGDWIKITPEGSAVVYGRSDSTINRLGVRMGSADIYRAVEALPEIADSLVVGIEQPEGGYYMPLFVVLRAGAALDEKLRASIKAQISRRVSPRHAPDEILAVSDVPRTLNGKKLEVPVKRLLMGVPLEQAVNPGAVANPESLEVFVKLAQARGAVRESSHVRFQPHS